MTHKPQENTQQPQKGKCGWGKMYRGLCGRAATVEMQTLTGRWTPICKRHLASKQRANLNNPWGALFPIETRPIT